MQPRASIGSSFGVPFVLLATIALLTTWLNYAVELPDEQRDARSRHDPDYWIEQITVHRFDPQGALQYALTASHWAHFPDDDTTQINTPQISLRHAGQDDTHITAGSARMTGSGDVVELRDQVRISGRGGRVADLPWQAETTHLTLVPDAETASTPAPVVFTQGRTRLSGTGLDFNHRDRRLELHHDVRGTIDRQKSR